MEPSDEHYSCRGLRPGGVTGTLQPASMKSSDALRMSAPSSNAGSHAEDAILARIDVSQEEIVRLEAVLRDLRCQIQSDEKALRDLRSSRL